MVCYQNLVVLFWLPDLCFRGRFYFYDYGFGLLHSLDFGLINLIFSINLSYLMVCSLAVVVCPWLWWKISRIVCCFWLRAGSHEHQPIGCSHVVLSLNFKIAGSWFALLDPFQKLFVPRGLGVLLCFWFSHGLVCFGWWASSVLSHGLLLLGFLLI